MYHAPRTFRTSRLQAEKSTPASQFVQPPVVKPSGLLAGQPTADQTARPAAQPGQPVAYVTWPSR